MRQKQAPHGIVQKKTSRRDVLRLGLLVSAGLPLILTLKPSEAQAYGS